MARKERSYLLEIGIVQTHIHLLARIRPTENVSALVKRLKGASSAIAGKMGLSCAGLKLYWAKGYSVQSVSPQSLGGVRRYIRSQPQHHPEEAIAGWTGDVAAEYDLSNPRDPESSRSLNT
jgi:putative transposase